MRPLVLLAALTLAGCASGTRVVDPQGAVGPANLDFSNKTVVVVLVDGTAYDADALRLAPDTTTWIDPLSRQLLQIPTSAIAEVERRDRRRAAWRSTRSGIVIGVVGGAVLGGLVGASAGDVCCGTGSYDQGASTAVFGVFGALTGGTYGALGGLLAGQIVDPVERYVIEPGADGGARPEPVAPAP